MVTGLHLSSVSPLCCFDGLQKVVSGLPVLIRIPGVKGRRPGSKVGPDRGINPGLLIGERPDSLLRDDVLNPGSPQQCLTVCSQLCMFSCYDKAPVEFNITLAYYMVTERLNQW